MRTFLRNLLLPSSGVGGRRFCPNVNSSVQKNKRLLIAVNHNIIFCPCISYCVSFEIMDFISGLLDKSNRGL
jgi:hypothetical protein